MVLDKICGKVPAVSVHNRDWTFLQGLPLADPGFSIPGRIDLLLGANLFGHTLTGCRKEGPLGDPVALETIFGWCLMGKVLGRESPPTQVALHAAVGHPLEGLVQRFWQLDHFPSIVGPQGPRDREVDQYFLDTCTRAADGRFTVALPFKPQVPSFPGIRDRAVRRFLALERRLERDPKLYEGYRTFMEDYIACGHMSVAQQQEGRYYIPHHPVLRPDSQTTKLRVVFDASAKAANGVSLNDVLEIGPPLQRPILAILIRFRFRAIGIMADIKQMYRQIEVQKADRAWQYIVWRDRPDQPLQEYMLNTVTYGVASVPFLALRSLRELARLEGSGFPAAAETLLSDVYMDDILSGGETVGEAQSLQSELIQLLHRGQFELRKWASNDAALLTTLDPSIDHQLAVSLGSEGASCVKVLGMQWSCREDWFSYVIQVEIRPCSKRTMLSDLARVFDPLGLMSPVIFLAKYWLQQLWMLGLDWDASVPDEFATQWRQWQQQLPVLETLRIPRYVAQSCEGGLQVHGFCDASERGYAAAIYLRAEQDDGGVRVYLLVAKTRVAPLRRRSIPRLELCAAVLLADLLQEVLAECQSWLKTTRVVAWSDSTIVLAWLQSQSAGYKPFVGNRIGHIQETVGAAVFRHVPTRWNPADAASRGVLPAELVQQEMWWTGPLWLQEPESAWPHPPVGEVDIDEDNKERKVLCLQSAIEGESLFTRFSRLGLLQTVIAWLFRFVGNCGRKKVGHNLVSGPLTRPEKHAALQRLIHQMQASVFGEQVSRLRKGKRLARMYESLNLFLDSQGLLRVGGRVLEADLGYQAKYPVLLPRSHPLTRLIIQDYHQKYLHPGYNTLHYLLRQNYWVLSPKRAIRACVKGCVRCFKAKPTPIQPLMGGLPPSRVLQCKAFTRVGVDFGGPFMVKPVAGRGRAKQAQKMYVCIFVCQATKAIHLELVFDLTADAFIAALRRFVARRGHCLSINCDNGTNFVGAARQLGKLMKDASGATDICFKFNPPRAPHFGGLFEAGIKSVKTHLQRVVGIQSLTIEEFLTFLAQVEALLNSRPLWPVSTDVKDFTALTPGHFLLLEPLSIVPDPNRMDSPLNTLSRWQFIQRLQQSFWRRWRCEYLVTLHQRQRWLKGGSQLLEGALVVVREDDVKPLQWELARVERVHPGKDGVARVATIRSSRGVFKRPVNRLCPLPMGDVT